MTRHLLLVGCLPLLLTGCGSSTNAFGLIPDGQPLLKEAKIARQVHGDPLPLPRELAKGLAPPFVVEPGDVLLIQPADFDSPVRFPGDQPVLPDGSIHLGKFGRLVVAGLTLEQVEAVVRGQIATVARDAGPLSVRIVSRQSKVFYVLGEVNAPGAYPLSGRETVLDAILIAGGLTRQACARKIILSRPTHPDECRIVLPVCYPHIVQLGDTTTNYQVHAGDRIFVPTKHFWDELCHCLGGKDCAACERSQILCTDVDGCDPPR